MNHKILFVDDEENILKALQRLLRKSPYETYFKNSGAEALECIRENEISVLVTDMRMPKMSGVELIIESNKISPMTIKTILSGYADIDDIMKAINSGHVHNYITKPWNESDLIISLMNATELYERRINEKRLTEELKLLNKSLEKRVKERTWELQANNAILNMIIEGEDHNEIMEKIAELLSKITGKNNITLLDNNSADVFGSGFLDANSEIVSSGKKKTSPCILKSVLIIPLTKGKKVLGTIFIGDVNKEELQFTEKIKNLKALLLMYLSQRALIVNSSEVIGSIDELLGNIND